MQVEKIKKIVANHLDMKPGKIEYVIGRTTMVAGLWSCLTHYGIEFNANNHDILVDCVQDILMHGCDVEYEWTEEQYNAFVKFNPNLLNENK